MAKIRVAVAMSGGVDSSVAAAMLVEQGYAVEGVFMKNWSPESSQALRDCPWEADQADAAAVCAKLGIPFRSVNFEREYYEKVVSYFLGEYQAGRTPNPDVLCNKEIKFRVLLEQVRVWGAEYLATGHYARIGRGEGGEPCLLRGLDRDKDQSYFLWGLNREQLERSLFPIGHLQKKEVRAVAARYGLPNATKKDSQGICFIGRLDIKKYLHEHLKSYPGSTYLVPPWYMGSTLEGRMQQSIPVGEHRGTIYYTIGERAGESLDNRRYRQIRERTDVRPVYVLAKEEERRALYVTDDPQDPHFFRREITLEGWWSTGGDEEGITTPLPAGEWTCQVRYHQKERVAIAAISPLVSESMPAQGYTVVTVEPLRAVASGQSLVAYAGERVMGGGIIR
jgi:tRNA-specific 2-thiouridylase